MTTTINLDDLIPENMKLSVEDQRPKFANWSQFQNDFFEAVTTSPTNLVLEAVAGSGKTTTILEAMRRLGTANVLFLAFNKSIQMELASRVPMGVTAKTLNGLGHNILSRHVESNRVNTYKAANILKDMLKKEVYDDYGYSLARVLSGARSAGVGIRTDLSHETWREFLLNGETYFEPENVDQFTAILQMAFQRMLDGYKQDFDFDDQLYLPIFHSWKFPKFDVVFVDEAQDLSYINHCQLMMLQQEGARIIAVGDTHQAIYGFRGADHHSMRNLAATFDARTMPLSICYRCGSSIVERAQHIVPYIQAAPDAPAGTIIDHTEYPHPTAYEAKSMIICRNNAPLFRVALEFLRERTPCHIVSDFPQDLLKLIDRMGVQKSADLRVKLEQWRDKEIEKLERLHRDHLIEGVQDKVNSLLPFCDEYPYAMQVKQAIKTLTESSSGPRLSSIHKAKGLESDHVYIVRPDLMPSQRALDAARSGNEAPLQQEENLQYVAITRAKLFLHYLPRG